MCTKVLSIVYLLRKVWQAKFGSNRRRISGSKWLWSRPKFGQSTWSPLSAVKLRRVGPRSSSLDVHQSFVHCVSFTKGVAGEVWEQSEENFGVKVAVEPTQIRSVYMVPIVRSKTAESGTKVKFVGCAPKFCPLCIFYERCGRRSLGAIGGEFRGQSGCGAHPNPVSLH